MGLIIDKYMVDCSKDSLKYAFNGRFSASSMNKSMVNKDDIADKYSEIMQIPSKGCVVYIHVPYCQSKCSFCGFAGGKVTKEEGKQYVNALMHEIELVTAYPYASETPVQAVYLGGGTPSAIEPEYLAELVEMLYESFNLANDCEITLEGRTHDFAGNRGKSLMDAGFNRFSIGVQTFDTKVRKSLGRISDRNEVIKILTDLTSYNKAAVIIDLIYGLPGQSVEMFLDDLKIAETTGIDGLDTYQLQIFETSQMKKSILAGNIPEAAPLCELGSYYKTAYDYLIKNQWHQISLNHYARTYRERNIYNPWVKRKAGCIAIGAGAGGSIDGWSYYRAPMPDKYIENIYSGNFTPDSIISPTDDRLLTNKVVEQMEIGYLKLGDFDSVKLMPYLENWKKANLANVSDDYLNLTTAGKFWGVNLTQAIIDILLTAEK